ncbi:MAG: hypothetical protein ACT4RN_17540 [Pseudonocardia sp.]
MRGEQLLGGAPGVWLRGASPRWPRPRGARGRGLALGLGLVVRAAQRPQRAVVVVVRVVAVVDLAGRSAALAAVGQRPAAAVPVAA